ncbi:UNVERIFIED_CONTAM: hypothetical protein K2H54_056222 [Gekko kuhli]
MGSATAVNVLSWMMSKTVSVTSGHGWAMERPKECAILLTRSPYDFKSPDGDMVDIDGPIDIDEISPICFGMDFCRCQGASIGALARFLGADHIGDLEWYESVECWSQSDYPHIWSHRKGGGRLFDIYVPASGRVNVNGFEGVE